MHGISKKTRQGAPVTKETAEVAAPEEAAKRERRLALLLLRAADLALRAVVETPLLHGRRLYTEATDIKKEVQAALGCGVRLKR
jgi:hypothetical protein